MPVVTSGAVSGGSLRCTARKVTVFWAGSIAAQQLVEERNYMRTKAIILAGGEGSRLGVLTAKRAKPAVPFAGKYRIIDFALSNCVNSGIFDVLVLTQYRPHSLN